MTQLRFLPFALILFSCSKAPEVSKTEAAPVAPVSKPEPAPAPVAPLVLAAGTPLSVRLLTTVSSDTHATGEAITGELTSPLVVQGKTVAPRGAQVVGIVSESTKGGRIKGLAQVSLRLTQLKLASGATVPVSTNARMFQAPKTVKRDAVAIGVSAGIGSAIGAIAGKGKGAAIGAGAGAGAGTAGVLATRGKAAVVPAETVMSFNLRAPVTL